MTSVAVVAGVVAATAAALAFDDATPCPVTTEGGQPLLVCPGGTVGASYSVQLVARGGVDPSFSFSVTNGALPSGLSMSSSALISGTPTQAGGSRFWVRVHDVGPAEGGPAWCTVPKESDREFALVINPGLRLVTNSLPQPASVGVAYSVPLEASLVTSLSPLAGTPVTNGTWSIVPGSGSLPPGLTLGNGVISGTPTAEGSYQFKVQVALDPTRTSAQTLTIVVRKPLAITLQKPFASTTAGAVTVWEVGVPFASKLAASGGTGTYTWAIADGALPAGMALAADGSIVGKASTAGVSRATLRLSDSEGRTADYQAVVGVAARLAVSTTALRPGKVGRLFRAKVATTGGVPDRKWKITSGPLPKGIHFDRTLGLLSGTPTKPGRYRVTFESTDALKVMATKTLVIEVLA